MTTYSIASARKGAAFGLLLLLGALTAFDSIAIDMYLPAFKAIESDLVLTAGMMPMSLSVFLIGLAVGQIISGPVADSHGRRLPLLVGIVLFGVASCLAAMSSNITMLLVGRFFQGIGGATGLVVPRAIVSDLYDAKQAPRIFTILSQVQSISPILAPILGGLVLNFWNWRSIFWVLAGCAVLAFVVAVPSVPETQPMEARTRLTFRNVLKNYWEILKGRRYLGMVLANGLIMGTLFGYISVSSFIFMSYFELSSSAYSLIFAAYSMGMILVGQLNMYLLSRMEVRRNLGLGFIIHLVFLGSLVTVLLTGIESLEIVGGLLFLAISSLSFLFGGLTSETMFSVGPGKSGSAAALLGMMQSAIGGGAGIVLGLIHDGTLMTPICTLFGCSGLACLCLRMASKLRCPAF